MDLHETPAQRELRRELREYFSTFGSTEERRLLGEAGAGGDRFREVVARFGQDGWLGIGWPTEYGGQGRSFEDEYVFFDELHRAGLPFPFVTVNTVGPTLMDFGTEEQKKDFLPRIVSGEVVFAIGYTEPSAGTDLASLSTRAERDGDVLIINGSKIFTTGGNTADYVWLACRTDPEVRKHKGISIAIVPTIDPGFSWTPIRTVGGMTITATYYSDIRVPITNVVGELGDGWKLITTQLNHERVGLAAQGGRMQKLWEDTATWAAETGVIEQPWVRAEFARLHAKLEAMRLMNWKMSVQVADGTLSGPDAGAVKIYGSETQIDVERTLSDIVGASGRVRPGGPGAVLGGQIEQHSRAGLVYTFGGGVNEVLRDMIAVNALDLPKRSRNA